MATFVPGHQHHTVHTETPVEGLAQGNRVMAGPAPTVHTELPVDGFEQENGVIAGPAPTIGTEIPVDGFKQGDGVVPGPAPTVRTEITANGFEDQFPDHNRLGTYCNPSNKCTLTMKRLSQPDKSPHQVAIYDTECKKIGFLDRLDIY